MFRNLEAEIKRAGLSRKELASKIGCDVSTLSGKLNGKTAFTLREAKRIKEILSVNISLDDLFETYDKPQIKVS